MHVTFITRYLIICRPVLWLGSLRADATKFSIASLLHIIFSLFPLSFFSPPFSFFLFSFTSPLSFSPCHSLSPPHSCHPLFPCHSLSLHHSLSPCHSLPPHSLIPPCSLSPSCSLSSSLSSSLHCLFYVLILVSNCMFLQDLLVEGWKKRWVVSPLCNTTSACSCPAWCSLALLCLWTSAIPAVPHCYHFMLVD